MSFAKERCSNADLWEVICTENGEKTTTLKSAFNPNKEKITINIVQLLLVFVLKKRIDNNDVLHKLNGLFARFCFDDFTEKDKRIILKALNKNSSTRFRFYQLNTFELLIFDEEILNEDHDPLIISNRITYKLGAIYNDAEEIKEKIEYKEIEKEISETSNFTKDTIESRIRINNYSDIVNEILPVFVGREFVFKRIDKFISKNNKGYFYVRANPGIGKTSLSIKLVEDTGYPFHIINPQHNGTDRYAKDFISNICAQLIKKYNLPFEHFPEGYGDDGGFLQTVLRAVSNEVENDEKVVIVVDGLDELKQEELTFFAKENILHLPNTLPLNIFFIITMRDLSKKGIELPKEISEDFLIEDLGEENIEDVRKYIKIASKDKRFEQYLKIHKVSKETFRETLEKKSEGSFMYLKYIFLEIADGDYTDVSLEKLPQGINEYYKEHFDRMMDVSDEVKKVKLKTMALPLF